MSREDILWWSQIQIMLIEIYIIYWSIILIILVALNNGSVWLLNFALLMVRSARFWSNAVWCNVLTLQFPHAKIHNIYENVLMNVLVFKQLFGNMFFTCLIENKALDIRLLTWAMWYFQLRFSSMKMPKNFTDCSSQSFPILFNILLLIATFSPVKLHWCCLRKTNGTIC